MDHLQEDHSDLIHGIVLDNESASCNIPVADWIPVKYNHTEMVKRLPIFVFDIGTKT